MCAKAQTDPVLSPGTPYTLHVYQDLLQLPTLVLNRAQRSYSGLTSAQFTLRLDDGPPFHPRHTRLEGDDPLQIALIVDASRASTLALAEKLEASTLPHLATWLNPSDEFSVYALDCHLIRSASDLPYTAPRLQNALAAALGASDLHQRDPGTACGSDRKLWDSLAAVVSRLSQSPGRRIILIVSDGIDNTSRTSWNVLAHYAGRYNTTLMGLSLLPATYAVDVPPMHRPLHGQLTEGQSRLIEDRFRLLCGQTGGVVLPADNSTVIEQLKSTIDLLRGRYILEFPRPHDNHPGLHHIDASVPDPHAVVLSAAIAFPPRKSTLDTDPGTVPSDPAQAPQFGHRKILVGPQ